MRWLTFSSFVVLTLYAAQPSGIVLRRAVFPIYPIVAKAGNTEAVIDVSLDVNASGEVKVATVLREKYNRQLGMPELFKGPLLAAVRQWRYSSGSPATHVLTFRYSLFEPGSGSEQVIFDEPSQVEIRAPVSDMDIDGPFRRPGKTPSR